MPSKSSSARQDGVDRERAYRRFGGLQNLGALVARTGSACQGRGDPWLHDDRAVNVALSPADGERGRDHPARCAVAARCRARPHSRWRGARAADQPVAGSVPKSGRLSGVVDALAGAGGIGEAGNVTGPGRAGWGRGRGAVGSCAARPATDPRMCRSAYIARCDNLPLQALPDLIRRLSWGAWRSCFASRDRRAASQRAAVTTASCRSAPASRLVLARWLGTLVDQLRQQADHGGLHGGHHA